MSFKTFFAIFLLLFAFFGVQGKSSVKADDLTERAKNGDIAASLQLGKEYFQGVKRPLNRALALYYFKLAADAGSPEAMFNIGMCYEYGAEFKADLLTAYHWYCKAGEFVPALFKKAVFLESGIPAFKSERAYKPGIPADHKQAADILNRLIQKKYPPALTYQAKKYLRSQLSKEAEFKEAFRLLSQAVKYGDISAYRLLADCYEWGMGCEKDERKAFELIKYAASCGDGAAAAKLGSYHEHGIGTVPDLALAVQAYKKSAELGEAIGMVQLAKHYSSGFIIETDLAKAIELCQHAAALNERSAFTQLGLFAAGGIGMAKNEIKAFQYFLKGAGMGDIEAQYHLALAFYDGKGTPVDKSGAFYWIKKSAAANYAPAVEKIKEWNIKL